MVLSDRSRCFLRASMQGPVQRMPLLVSGRYRPIGGIYRKVRRSVSDWRANFAATDYNGYIQEKGTSRHAVHTRKGIDYPRRRALLPPGMPRCTHAIRRETRRRGASPLAEQDVPRPSCPGPFGSGVKRTRHRHSRTSVRCGDRVFDLRQRPCNGRTVQSGQTQTVLSSRLSTPPVGRPRVSRQVWSRQDIIGGAAMSEHPALPTGSELQRARNSFILLFFTQYKFPV